MKKPRLGLMRLRSVFLIRDSLNRAIWSSLRPLFLLSSLTLIIVKMTRARQGSKTFSNQGRKCGKLDKLVLADQDLVSISRIGALNRKTH